MRSLDSFRCCAAPGCLWRVQSEDPDIRCWDHGGPGGIPQYAEGEDGDIIAARFCPAPTECVE